MNHLYKQKHPKHRHKQGEPCHCGHKHDHQHIEPCHCGQEHHPTLKGHDSKTCSVCKSGEAVTPKEYLDRIEKELAKIPKNKQEKRIQQLIALAAGTAASAAAHKDDVMLQIIEVYLALRVAEELGQPMSPETAQNRLREIAATIGLGLTAKYGLAGLMKVGISKEGQIDLPTLVFVNCYGLGRVLVSQLEQAQKGKQLDPEQVKNLFKAAKTEAIQIAKSILAH